MKNSKPPPNTFYEPSGVYIKLPVTPETANLLQEGTTIAEKLLGVFRTFNEVTDEVEKWSERINRTTLKSKHRCSKKSKSR